MLELGEEIESEKKKLVEKGEVDKASSDETEWFMRMILKLVHRCVL